MKQASPTHPKTQPKTKTKPQAKTASQPPIKAHSKTRSKAHTKTGPSDSTTPRRPPPLNELQGQLLQAIAGPAATDFDLDAVVCSDEKLDARGRVAIYGDMYFWRIRDAVLEDYPVLAEALDRQDGKSFDELVRAFIKQHPPAKPSLRWTGERLPSFLAEWPHAEPWFAALAALEWARVDVFDAPDDDILTPEKLAAELPEQLADLPLHIVQASRLVPAPWSIEAFWSELTHGSADSERIPEKLNDHLSDRKTGLIETAPDAPPLVVWRGEKLTFHRRLSAQEESLWPQLSTGTTFGLLCEALGADHSAEEAAQAAVSLMSQWSHEGLLADRGE